MSTTAGLLSALTRTVFSRGTFIQDATSSVSRVNVVRTLALSSQRSAQSTDDAKEVKSEPIKFSTSKASHRTWKVEHALGSQFERPWWRVLPVSLLGIGFLLWCALRPETDIDQKLSKHLYEHLPSLRPDEEEEDEQQNKPS